MEPRVAFNVVVTKWVTLTMPWTKAKTGEWFYGHYYVPGSDPMFRDPFVLLGVLLLWVGVPLVVSVWLFNSTEVT
jgi:hypothetical protein